MVRNMVHQRSLFRLPLFTVIYGSIDDNKVKNREFFFNNKLEKQLELKYLINSYKKKGFQIIYSYPKDIIEKSA